MKGILLFLAVIFGLFGLIALIAFAATFDLTYFITWLILFAFAYLCGAFAKNVDNPNTSTVQSTIKVCPFCHTITELNAKVCPHCAAVFGVPAPTQ